MKLGYKNLDKIKNIVKSGVLQLNFIDTTSYIKLRKWDQYNFYGFVFSLIMLTNINSIFNGRYAYLDTLYQFKKKQELTTT